MYFVEKNITRLRNYQPTFFLDPKELKEVTSKLKKDEYSIYKPYLDSEKNILYHKNKPEVLLYEIHCNSLLRHQDILGSLYSLNIDKGLFGDILIINGKYYIYILKILKNYFESNFLTSFSIVSDLISGMLPFIINIFPFLFSKYGAD